MDVRAWPVQAPARARQALGQVLVGERALGARYAARHVDGDLGGRAGIVADLALLARPLCRALDPHCDATARGRRSALRSRMEGHGMSVQLRDYQRRMVDDIRQRWADGNRAILGVLP